MVDGILKGLRVIEWGDLVSGPWAARLMADMGADVIKVESPGSGDTSRRVGPFPGDVPHPETSGLFLYLNINKRGVTLDLTKAEGLRIFKELVARRRYPYREPPTPCSRRAWAELRHPQRPEPPAHYGVR